MDIPKLEDRCLTITVCRKDLHYIIAGLRVLADRYDGQTMEGADGEICGHCAGVTHNYILPILLEAECEKTTH